MRSKNESGGVMSVYMQRRLMFVLPRLSGLEVGWGVGMAGNASVKEEGVRFRSDRCEAVKLKVVGHIYLDPYFDSQTKLPTPIGENARPN